MGTKTRMNERDRLLQAYAEAQGEEKARILAKLAVMDEEGEKDEKMGIG